MGGETGRQATNKDRDIKQVTTVGIWGLICLDKSGKQCRTCTSELLLLEVRDLEYLTHGSCQPSLRAAGGRVLILWHSELVYTGCRGHLKRRDIGANCWKYIAMAS